MDHDSVLFQVNSMDRNAATQPVLVKRTLACENIRFFVFLDELTSYDRSSISDYLVVAPKEVTANLVTGVAILPVCKGKIGLIRAYRHAIRGDSWEIPRGFTERGEGDLNSALRELKEETGLACEASEIKSLGYVTPDAGILAARLHIYAALRCMRTKPYVPLEFGHQEFRVFSRDEIESLIERSEIQYPCTLIAYTKYIRL